MARKSLGENLTALSGGALAACLLLVAGLILLLVVHGLASFWQPRVARVELADGGVLLGEIHEREPVPGDPSAGHRIQLRTGNRDVTGSDFTWVDESAVRRTTYPADVVLLERLEWGSFLGRVIALRSGETVLAEGPDASWAALPGLVAAKARESADVRALERGAATAEGDEFDRLDTRLSGVREALARETAVLETAAGETREVPVAAILRAIRPNELGLAGRIGLWAARLWEFLSGEPRESNTEGGIFPAIFGTVMMVFLATFAVTPLGVLAAIYLREYARQGPLVRAVRIAVNNLAGVPSIVFGMFGLGFFVYLVGGTIDRLFYADALPAPTFGTGGILWASLTLALLTVPVVIVATEEGLAAVPRAVREGSMALGATKFETTFRIVVPAATPGILTGVILAMARAAGEVAPLMIVGMVKLAPRLPVDGTFPFVHLERKFMHLGFHIYDLGFQSPNVEASKPLVFATALLLVAVVTLLNLAAFALRNHLRRKYTTGAV